MMLALLAIVSLLVFTVFLEKPVQQMLVPLINQTESLPVLGHTTFLNGTVAPYYGNPTVQSIAKTLGIFVFIVFGTMGILYLVVFKVFDAIAQGIAGTDIILRFERMTYDCNVCNKTFKTRLEAGRHVAFEHITERSIEGEPESE